MEHSILWEYIGSVDVELSVILNTCISYYYALPNKIFESIQAMIPLIVSNFPEMERIVKMYDIGVCCKSDDVNSLVEAIRLMNKDKVLYSRFKANMQDAKKELCWENEKEILEGAYRSILMDI
nr:glycosyltransferase [Bacteroides fragilis]